MRDPPARCGNCEKRLEKCDCPARVLHSGFGAVARFRELADEVNRLAGRKPRKRRKKRGKGKTSEDAAKLLSKHFGVDVTADDLILVNGAWIKEDVYRFEAGIRFPGRDLPKYYGCWDKMTEFVRLGKQFGLSHDDENKEVWANVK